MVGFYVIVRAGYVLAMRLLQSNIELDEEERGAVALFVELYRSRSTE